MNTEENEVMSLDDAIMSGDMDAIEAAVAAVDGAQPISTEDKPVVAEGEVSPEASASSSASEEDKGNQEEPEGVLSKKGDRVLPYSELADSREAARLATEKAALLETELETLKGNPQVDPAVAEELDRTQRLNAILQQQLEGEGVKPKPLPEEFTIDPEKLKELAEYGEVGEMVGMLAQQNKYLMEQIGNNAKSPATQQPAAVSTDPNDFGAVMASDTDLTRWAKSKHAIRIVDEMDEYVQTLPEFQGKSLSERKDKVVELTRKQLGEAAAPTPQSQAEKAEQIIRESGQAPTSLSEVGGTSSADSTEKTLSEQMQGMDEVELAEFMSKQMAAGVAEDVLLDAL